MAPSDIGALISGGVACGSVACGVTSGATSATATGSAFLRRRRGFFTASGAAACAAISTSGSVALASDVGVSPSAKPTLSAAVSSLAIFLDARLRGEAVLRRAVFLGASCSTEGCTSPALSPVIVVSSVPWLLKPPSGVSFKATLDRPSWATFAASLSLDVTDTAEPSAFSGADCSVSDVD